VTALYIHIPFCVRKCPYCSFYSRTGTGEEMRDFVDAASLHILRLHSLHVFSEIKTIYIGGGTPTSLPDDALRALLGTVSVFAADDAEFTCEANPDSVTIDKLRVLKEFGVNRLSLGVQSFSDVNLEILGRLHDSHTAAKAYNTARDTGFANISIDLVYGLPGQVVMSWVDDLKQAIALHPEHISLYGLTIETGTKFEELYGGAESKGKLPAEEVVREMYYCGINVLRAAGYKQYEISNFALPGYESRHNLNYWRHGKYLAIGPSASGFDGKRRWKNLSDTGRYIDAIKSGDSTTDEEEQLSTEQLISEALMLGLRLREGVSLRRLSSAYDVDLMSLYSGTIRSLEKIGMLEVEGDIIHLTSDGLFVSNAVISEFMLVQ